MKLSTALTSFLKCFYYIAPPPGDLEPSVSAQQFFESVIARGVQSPDFRRRLLTDPETVLKEIGIQLPQGVKVTFVENTDQLVHIVIPPYIGE